MKAYRENPDGEENIQMTKQNQRQVFAAIMQAKIRTEREDGYCTECGMMASQCQCWDSVNGGN